MGPQMLELSAVALSLLSLWMMLLAQKFSGAIHEVILFLPVYGIVSLGCYALGSLGFGVMVFPICDSESKLLQKDIAEAHQYLASNNLVVQPSTSSNKKD